MDEANIMAFGKASDGGILIAGHYNNFFHYDPRTEKFTTFGHKDFPTLHMAFRNIADDGLGNFYLGHAGYGFSVVNPKTGQTENYVHDPVNPESLPGNNVRCIHIDIYKNVWLGTNHGLALFNPATKKFTTFPREKSGQTIYDNIYSIMEADDGRLWIGSDLGGVSLFDIRDLSLSNKEKLRFETLPISDNNGLSSPNVHDILQDSLATSGLPTTAPG